MVSGGREPVALVVRVDAAGVITRRESAPAPAPLPGGGGIEGQRVVDVVDTAIALRLRRLLDEAFRTGRVGIETLEPVDDPDAARCALLSVVPTGSDEAVVSVLVAPRAESDAAAVASLLANAVAPNPQIHALLASVGTLVGCDAVSLLELDNAAGELVLRAGWMVEEPEPPPLPQSWPLESFPGLLAQLELSAEPIVIRSLEALPERGQIARVVLGGLGVDAFVGVPIPGTPQPGLLLLMWRQAPTMLPSSVLLGAVRDLIGYLPGAITPGRVLEGILDQSDELVAVVDARGEFQYANPAAAEFAGDAELGPALAERIAPQERALFAAAIERSLAHPGEAVAMRLRATDDRGQVVTLKGSCLGLSGTELCLVRLQRRGSRHQAPERQRDASARNPLTELTNRTAALQDLGWRLGHAGRNSVALVLVDLDDFRRIKHSFGHDVSDEVLARLAGRLLHAVDQQDTVARVDGDEFIVVATITADLSAVDAAHRIATRIAHTIAEPISVEGHTMQLSASIGFVVTTDDARCDVDTLVRDAETALAYAKKRGKNRIEAFEPQMRTELNDALELETSLHEALAAGALTVAYQPIIELESGQPAGVEALARWPRSRHTPVGPSVFVPLAEQTGLIHSLGDWLIRTTASHHSTWGRPELGLAVNVSIRQLERPEFPAIATTHFMGAGVSPDAVVFEVTETSYAHADDTVVAGLQSLRSRGFRVALDDFGAGNSSFDRIRRYPIDVVKIDRAYTELADADAADRSIIEAMIAMTHALGATVVAEGVERPSQREALRALGCDQAQGFLFSEPLDPTSVTAFFDS